jgi:hypothetical protein
MSQLVRALVWLITLGTLFVAGGVCLEGCGDLAQVGTIDGDIDEARRVSEELERRHDNLRAFIELCGQATIDVIEERLTLNQAAERFRHAHEWLAAPHPPNLAFFPGTYEEKLCHCVIRHVEAALEGSPERRAAVVARLKAELSDSRNRVGERGSAK